MGLFKRGLRAKTNVIDDYLVDFTTEEKIENSIQEFIYLRQDFIELQRELLHFISSAKQLEKKRKRQRWKFYHK